jgi:hypothetical protein
MHRIVLVAVHAGLSPWTPAVPFLADAPGSGGDVLGAAAQQVLGYGVTGAVALVLAWIVWKGSFVPQKRVDEMIAASRADLLREIERLVTEKEKVEAQLAENLRFARDDLAPILFQFNASTSSLLPILQRVVQNADDNSFPRRRGRESQ